LYERVHTVWDYYDGILDGVANFRGNPHYFSVIRKDVDPVDTYELKEIDSVLFEAVVEQWSIYRRWEARFHASQLPVDTHPGKGGIDARYDELEIAINSGIQTLSSVPTVATGEFRPIENQPDLPKGCFRELEVLWTPAT
jgi:hypothetical protein